MLPSILISGPGLMAMVHAPFSSDRTSRAINNSFSLMKHILQHQYATVQISTRCVEMFHCTNKTSDKPKKMTASDQKRWFAAKLAKDHRNYFAATTTTTTTTATTLLLSSSVVFTARRNARISSAVLATAIPYVCPSVRHTPVLCQNDGT